RAATATPLRSSCFMKSTLQSYIAPSAIKPIAASTPIKASGPRGRLKGIPTAGGPSIRSIDEQPATTSIAPTSAAANKCCCDVTPAAGKALPNAAPPSPPQRGEGADARCEPRHREGPLAETEVQLDARHMHAPGREQRARDEELRAQGPGGVAEPAARWRSDRDGRHRVAAQPQGAIL